MSSAALSPIPAYLVGTAFLGVGLMAFADPSGAYKQFGIPLSPSLPEKTHPAAYGAVSPFLYAKAARDITFGLTYFLLQYTRNARGVTAFSMAAAVTGCVDGWIAWAYGGELRGTAWNHWTGTAVFTAWVAMRLLKHAGH